MPKIEGDKVYEKESWRERMKGKKKQQQQRIVEWDYYQLSNEYFLALVISSI